MFATVYHSHIPACERAGFAVATGDALRIEIVMIAEFSFPVLSHIMIRCSRSFAD